MLIWIGFCTPLAAASGTAVQIIGMILARELNSCLLVVVALSLSLALLGPGAWSLDARLFGRKRLI